jgi:hypothetical protein
MLKAAERLLAALRPTIEKTLLELPAVHELCLCGHSLGGGLAALMAVLIGPMLRKRYGWRLAGWRSPAPGRPRPDGGHAGGRRGATCGVVRRRSGGGERMSGLMTVSDEVAAAVAAGRPVVALETTLVTHGLPQPDHGLFASHPVINEELYARIDSGAIAPARDVVAFEGAEAVFADGRREPFDVVICATGYRIAHPFIAPEHLCEEDGCPRLFLNLLHPTRNDIAVVGLIQPDSGQWGITDAQGRLVAQMAVAARHAPRAAAWLYRQRQRPAAKRPIEYVDSPRHRLEVEHFSYRRRLERLIQSMDRRLHT